MNGSIDYRLALDKTAAGLEATWILPEEVGARFKLAPGPDLRDAILAICRVVHAARNAGLPLAPDAAASITHLTTQPDPLGAAGRFRQAVAAGDLPELPPALPPELADIFTALIKALRG
jgi:hypothetical protein